MIQSDSAPRGHFANLPIEAYRQHFQPGDHILLDVREPEEWMMGYIPGAIHIPLNDLPDRVGEIPADVPVVVVCASGVRSLYAAEYLLSLGYPEVYNLADGTKGWMMRGLPLDR